MSSIWDALTFMGGDRPSRAGAPRGRRVHTARRDAKIRKAFESGSQVAEIAAKFGLARSAVYKALRAEGIALIIPSHGTADAQARNACIIEAYKGGRSGEEIAQQHDITRERVYQILRPQNLTNLKLERKRVAREEAERERYAVRASLESERADMISRVVEILKTGGSINDAVRLTGAPVHVAQQARKAAGLPLTHGRWGRETEFEQRKKTIKAAREAGKTWDEIGRSEYAWAVRHMPELFHLPRIHKAANAAVSSPFRKPPAKPLVPEFEWTEHHVSELIRMYLSGCSAQQIGDVLGCTRNAVIGKTNRLRSEGRFQAATRDGDST